jgi:peptide/nickel transport system substrate-binding protein
MSQLKLLERLFAKGEISRREFLTRASALGLTVAMSPMLLTKPAYASGPKKGGRLRIGTQGGSTTDSFDPATIADNMSILICWQLRNNLIEIDHNSQPIPELAESWESSPDAKKWIVKIRKGVEFHNGKTLDADDVIFSINHHRGEDSKSGAKAIIEPIKEIKKDDKYTVIFTLSGGSADFPFLLSDFHLNIVPNGTTNFEDGIGTGGYMLVSHEPGVRCITKRNPNYWKASRAHFDEVETLHIADGNARITALKTGAVDVINRCDRKIYHLLEKDPNIQTVESFGMKHYSLPMMTDTPPYDNNDVRLGLKHAIDREQLLKVILRGHGQVGNDHPIATVNRYHATEDELPQRKYDPDKARYHLKKAGLENHTFKLHTSKEVFDGAMDLAVIYQENAKESGINLEVVLESNDGYFTNIWMNRPWMITWWYGRPTEDWMFSTTYSADAPWNESHWKNERFNKLLEEARAELDEKKRREMYVDMQRIVSNEGGSVIPLFASDLHAAGKKLKYQNIAGNYEFDGMKLPERWWFES